jgi:hypothetical protein
VRGGAAIGGGGEMLGAAGEHENEGGKGAHGPIDNLVTKLCQATNRHGSIVYKVDVA